MIPAAKAKPSLGTKISLALVLVLACTLSATFYWDIAKRSAARKASFEKKSIAISSVIQAGISADLSEPDITVSELQSLCERFRGLEEVRQVQLFDAQARLMASSDRKDLGRRRSARGQPMAIFADYESAKWRQERRRGGRSRVLDRDADSQSANYPPGDVYFGPVPGRGHLSWFGFPVESFRPGPNQQTFACHGGARGR
jgi:hypothetical protein